MLAAGRNCCRSAFRLNEKRATLISRSKWIRVSGALSRRINWRWSGTFGLLFLLSQDFWFWDGAVVLGPGNFPLRIYYFLMLQLLLTLLLLFFVRRRLRRGSGKPGS
jgi:hypothetical protein